MKAKRAEFQAFLKRTLSAEFYEQIPERLNITKAKWSRLLSGTDDFTVEELIQLAEVIDANPLDLIQEYHLGASMITIDQASRLGVQSGLSLEYVPHVA